MNDQPEGPGSFEGRTGPPPPPPERPPAPPPAPPPAGPPARKGPPPPPPPPPRRADAGAAGAPSPGQPGAGPAEAGAPTYPAAPGAAPPGGPPARQRTSGLAVASLILGIAGFTCLFLLGSILAVIFGFAARSEIRKSGGMKRGAGMATAGIVLGFVLIALVVIGAAVFIPLSYVGVGPTRTVTRDVDAGAAQRVRVSLAIDKGDLTVSGGAARLMEGSFTYNSPRWRPRVSYEVTGTGLPGGVSPTGELRVRQGAERWWRFWQWIRGRNEWSIRLGGSAPIDLSVDQSWGESNFDLLGIPLSRFRADSSAGDMSARLHGRMELLEEISLDQSAGDIELVMDGDYPAMRRLAVDSSAGSVEVDLTGTWGTDLTGVIGNSAGGITLKLPRDIGVHVTADSSAGDVDAEELESRGGNVWVNESYGRTPVTLRLEVSNSAGDIDLELE